MQVYRNIRVEPTDDARGAAYPAAQYQETESYPFGQGTGEAVPLEEYDFGSYKPVSPPALAAKRRRPGPDYGTRPPRLYPLRNDWRCLPRIRPRLESSGYMRIQTAANRPRRPRSWCRPRRPRSYRRQARETYPESFRVPKTCADYRPKKSSKPEKSSDRITPAGVRRLVVAAASPRHLARPARMPGERSARGILPRGRWLTNPGRVTGPTQVVSRALSPWGRLMAESRVGEPGSDLAAGHTGGTFYIRARDRAGIRVVAGSASSRKATGALGPSGPGRGFTG